MPATASVRQCCRRFPVSAGIGCNGSSRLRFVPGCANGRRSAGVNLDRAVGSRSLWRSMARAELSSDAVPDPAVETPRFWIRSCRMCHTGTPLQKMCGRSVASPARFHSRPAALRCEEQARQVSEAQRAPQACRLACMWPRDSAAIMPHCTRLYCFAPIISRFTGPVYPCSCSTRR